MKDIDRIYNTLTTNAHQSRKLFGLYSITKMLQ